MKRVKKAGIILLIACMLFSTYGNRALASGQAIEEKQSEDSKNVEEETSSEQDRGETPDQKEDESSGSESNLGNEEEKETIEAPDKEAEEVDSSSSETEKPKEEFPDEETMEGETQDDPEDDETQDGEEGFAEETEITELEDETEVKESAETLPAVSEANTGEVSRADWLSELVSIFEFSVAEDNYPDNYFSDIDISSDYYRTIMLATEFGLVDVKAGEAFCPDDAATREFAVHTLNFCLGFMPAEENEYTYSEAGEVAYADDIQVAVERNWLLLDDGKFLPEAAITSAEKTVMITDAKTVLAARKEKPTHTNNYTFAEGVIDLTNENVQVEMTDDNVLTFRECMINLEAGQKYGLEFDGFPTVIKALDINKVGDDILVSFEAVPLDEAFATIDMQGGMEVNLATAQAYSGDIELQYIVGGTEAEEWEDGTKYNSLEEVGNQEISAIEATKSYELSDEIREEFNIAPGVKATVSCKVSDVSPDYDINLLQWRAHVGVSAKVIANCNIKANIMEAAGISPTLELVRIPIACVGYFGVKLNMTISGEATLSLVENVYLGLYYEYSAFRLERNFTKESFTLQTRIEFSSELTATLGMNCCNIMKGELYAKFGAKNVLDSITYTDEKKPTMCGHHTAWFFASVGGFAEIKLPIGKESWNKTYTIYDETNSPIRISFHYEDGVAVPKCTRGRTYGPSGKSWGYYTSADSRYGYNGASKGTDAKGEPYTIFDYTLDDAGRATITGYKGNVSALSIPEMLDEHEVVKIGNSVFKDNKQLRMVTIPDSVVEIEGGAFKNCINLAHVTLSKKLESITSSVFYDCSALTAIEIPKSLKNVYTPTGSKKGVFANCDNLKTVSFEEGTTQITGSLFANCLGIEKITIPNTVTVINGSAFDGCSNLLEIVIPDNVKEIGPVAFRNCVKLKHVTLSKRLESINSSAFYNCDALTVIEIPRSLKNVYTPTGSKRGVFANCDNLSTIEFEQGTTQIVESLLANCGGISEITIPDGIKEIGIYAFESCENLKKVKLPNSITKINSCAFRDCINLSNMILPDGVNELGNRVFENCVGITKIALPDSIVRMGTHVFFECSNLQEVTLSNNIISISESTFRNCNSLEKINFPEALESICDYSFYNTKLSEVILPDKLIKIGNYGFYNCDLLTKAVVPDSVTSLGSYVFADCELLEDVSLGTGITVIPTYAFHLCPSLQKITLPYRTAEIKKNAFTNCTSLVEVTIPRTTVKIADDVFSYPARLTIYGIAGTYAETYAQNIGATFINQENKATEVKLNTANLKLVKGKTATLILSVVPSNFTDQVTWKSTDTNVASVDDNGRVTAKAIGTATVKVTVGDIDASCKITVTQPVTSIGLNKSSLSLEAEATERLTATVSPSTAENKAITWSTSDTKIASVDETGLVTAKAKGTAQITAIAQDGSGISRSCAVTVVNNGYLCSSVGELESPHNYPVNCSDFWKYTKEGAESLYLTFDSRTNVEEDFDFIYLYDGKGKQIGKYTGTQLAGQIVEVPGDTVKIKLVSDNAGTAWGFKVTNIIGTGDVENDECLVTFDVQGGTVVPAVWVKRGTAVSKPENPAREGYEFLGWYLGEEVYSFELPVNKNLILHAKWRYIVIESDISEEDRVPEEDLPESGIVPNGLWIAGVKDQTYTGKALKPVVRVYDGTKRLKEKTDYTVSYKNNTKANDAADAKKAPTITVKGKGNYTGAATAVFKIFSVDLNDASVSVVTDTIANNHKVQKKAPTLTFSGKRMSVKRDYILSYPAQEDGAYQEAGRYPIQITGVGNFTGTRTVYLEITDKILINKVKSVKIPDQIYKDGEEITLSQTDIVLYIKSKQEPLVEGVDYTTAYENNREIGTAAVIITGIGDYAGTKRLLFKIKGTAIKKAVVIGIEDKVYDGTDQLQNITVKAGDKVLTLGKDYTVTYSKNRNAGTANLTIQGIGAYSGTVKKSFKITAYDFGVDEKNLLGEIEINQTIESASDTGQEISVAYTKGGNQPQISLKFGDTELIKGKDYTVTYQNNKKIADMNAQKAPTIIIKGKGNFKGRLSRKFSIVKKNITDARYPITMSVADVAFVKGAGKYVSKPVLTDTNGKTLKAGTDYITLYMAADGITKLGKKSTVQAGSYVCVSVQGKGNYEGTLTTTYRITQTAFSKAVIKVSPQIYTGRKIYLREEDIIVKIGGEKLVYGEDYEVLEDSFTNNIQKGTASVKIRGIHNYGGIRTVKFKIQAKKMESFSEIIRGFLNGK